MSVTACEYRDLIAYSDNKANKIVVSEAEQARTSLWCLKPGQPSLPVKAGSIVVAAAGISHGIDNSGSSGLVFVSISAG
jgi:quercetin dioxygenase-like cupin family protein